MKNYRITVNGKTYEVTVEETGASAPAAPATPAAPTAPAPAKVSNSTTPNMVCMAQPHSIVSSPKFL